jgi:hypothetical protein
MFRRRFAAERLRSWVIPRGVKGRAIGLTWSDLRRAALVVNGKSTHLRLYNGGW